MRPLINGDLISRCIDTVKKYGNVITITSANDQYCALISNKAIVDYIRVTFEDTNVMIH